MVVSIMLFLSTITQGLHGSWLYPLINKPNVFYCFVNFKSLVENLFSSQIKQFQIDNGGEFTSHQFNNFLSLHGIYHHLTCPYTSQQNGISR